jgi:hypothetical protein
MISQGGRGNCGNTSCRQGAREGRSGRNSANNNSPMKETNKRNIQAYKHYLDLAKQVLNMRQQHYINLLTK